jgi:hypothetical protein
MIITSDGTYLNTSARSFNIFIGDPSGAAHTDFGGGTLTLQRLVDTGDPSNSDDWVTVNDTSTGTERLMSYTSGPEALTVEFQSVSRIRAVLSGSTSPDLRVDILRNPK